MKIPHKFLTVVVLLLAAPAALGLKEKPSFSEIVADTPMQIAKSPKGWKLAVPMEKNMTRVIRIN